MILRTRYGVLQGCDTHDRQVQRRRSNQPKSKCIACWMCFLSEQLETSLYRSDVESILQFANKIPKTTLKSLDWKEEMEDEGHDGDED
jgi:hypothetical protein